MAGVKKRSADDNGCPARVHLPYPIDNNKKHNPDKFDVLHGHLAQACEVINSTGGIDGKRVTMEEIDMRIHSIRGCM